MKAQELRNKSIQELQTLLTQKREDLRNMNFKVAQRQLKKVSTIRDVKRDIARILTIISHHK